MLVAEVEWCIVLSQAIANMTTIVPNLASTGAYPISLVDTGRIEQTAVPGTVRG